MKHEILNIEPSSHQNTAVVVQILVEREDGTRRAHSLAVGRVDYANASDPAALVKDKVNEYLRHLEDEGKVPDLVDVSEIAAVARGDK